jgi:hypothetical protein
LECCCTPYHQVSIDFVNLFQLDIYNNFKDAWKVKGSHETYFDLLLLITGTCIGLIIVVVLVLIENRNPHPIKHNKNFLQDPEIDYDFSTGQVLNGIDMLLRTKKYKGSPLLQSALEYIEEKESEEVFDAVQRTNCYSVLKLLSLMFMLCLWSISLTIIFALLFHLFNTFTLQHINSFCRGLSGGAFLSTVSGSMIPRLTEDSVRSGWSSLSSRIWGVNFFVFGLVFGCLIDVLIPT